MKTRKNLFFLLAFLFLFLILKAQTQTTSAYPTDAESVGKSLCQSINLDYPGLEKVKAMASIQKYAIALEAWRDYKVKSIRKSNLGPFGWHGNQLNRLTVLPVADYMVGKITEQEFLASKSGGKDVKLLNIAGINEAPSSINWMVKNAEGNYPDVYANFYNFIPLSGCYYKSGDVVYLKKWFQLAGDFACRQKLEVEKIPLVERKKINCNWTTDAQAALSQSDRISSIIRSLGVFCKSLPDGGKPALWDSIYVPNNYKVPDKELQIIPALQLAQVAFSLVFDHPKAIMARYLRAGAVPNQRRAGLTSLILISTQFPEFTVCPDILEQTTTGINDYLAGAFYKDGGMLEQSFNYNMGDAAALKDMVELLANKTPALTQQLKEKQTAFYRLTAAIRTPFGELPAMSSCPSPNPKPIWNDLAARKSQLVNAFNKMPGQTDAGVAEIASQFNFENKTKEPAFTSIRFPYSGYYVQRKNWNWDSPYLFFQDSRPARGHANMGHNAIQVMAYGRPLLVSAGQPVYSAGQLPDEMKNDFMAINELLGEDSSLKTNTVMVDGKSQSRGTVSQTAYPEPIDARWLTSANFDFMEGYFDLGYRDAGKVNHRRMVTFVRDPGFWIVADIMRVLDNKEHSFSQIWNFPAFNDTPPTLAYGFKKEELQIDKNGMHTSDPTGPNVWLYHFGVNPIDYKVNFGQKNPYLGWFVPSFGNLLPANQVFAGWKSSTNSVLITIIWPTPNNIAPTFTKVKNIATPSDAGFTMSLNDGRRLVYQVADTIQNRKTDIGTFDAQSLLTVYSKNGTASGIVVGKSEAKPSVYEYIWKKNQLKIINE